MYDTELERLHLLEGLFDPATIERLERIGVREGWSCLEVAAGGGSIAAWLGYRVGSRGRVLAGDIDIRFLGHLSAPVEVRTVNLLTDELESSAFDVVHSRSVLHHLYREAEEVVANMARAAKPGGWLLIDEPDWEGLAGIGGHPEADLFSEDWRSISRRLKEAGLVDTYFGRHVRDLVEGVGFEDVAADGATGIWRGGEAAARFVELSFLAFHTAGMATDEEFDRAARLLRDPSFAFKFGILFGAWGRRRS